MAAQILPFPQAVRAMPGAPECEAGSKPDDLMALIPQMRAFARALCRDRAQGDDLAQDALLSAWRGRDSYAPGTNMKAWVFTIVRNQFYSDKRRSRLPEMNRR
jgi:RNA polymerase sigma-70 factor (ECF subfamily)